MNECRNCKHWYWDDDDDATRLTSAQGNCERSHSESGEPMEGPAALMYALDAENYHAWLVTKPNFGCVLFEPLGPDEAQTPQTPEEVRA